MNTIQVIGNSEFVEGAGNCGLSIEEKATEFSTYLFSSRVFFFFLISTYDKRNSFIDQALYCFFFFSKD